MKKPLHLLFIDSATADTELLCQALQSKGYQFEYQQVDRAETLVAALEQRRWDLVFCSDGVAQLDSLSALALVKSKGAKLPFIIIAERASVDQAVEAMRAGVSDYLKKDDVDAVATAVERVLRGWHKDQTAAEALDQSEARLRALLEQLPAMVWTTDKELRFTSFLGEELKRLHLTQNELVGMTLAEYLRKNQLDDSSITAHRRALEGFSARYDLDLDGRDYAVHVQPLRAPSEEIIGTVGVALDNTERRQLERQVRGAQRMEAIGRLAGGIAHDFNNLLLVIANYSQFVLDEIPKDSTIYEDIKEIQEAVQRASALTKQLLAFSSRQIMQPEILDLNRLVGELKKMMERLISEDILFVAKLNSDIGSIKADRSQVEQVIMNLLVNATDAMPHGGELSLKTENVDVDAEMASKHMGMKPGSYVAFSVTDSGEGMDEATKSRVFEPFFTTKAKGKGTGLGLSTVYGVVKQSDGYISVDSSPGAGTTFKVYLPRVNLTPTSRRQLSPSKSSHEARDAIILLVEDDDIVRKAALRTLKRDGYTVLEACHGKEALSICKTGEKPIDLLLTDVVMPNMSGRELSRLIESLKPDTRTLFMSGYTDNMMSEDCELEEGVHFLPKPFTPDVLLRKVREVLDS